MNISLFALKIFLDAPHHLALLGSACHFVQLVCWQSERIPGGQKGLAAWVKKLTGVDMVLGCFETCGLN